MDVPKKIACGKHPFIVIAVINHRFSNTSSGSGNFFEDFLPGKKTCMENSLLYEKPRVKEYSRLLIKTKGRILYININCYHLYSKLDKPSHRLIYILKIITQKSPQYVKQFWFFNPKDGRWFNKDLLKCKTYFNTRKHECTAGEDTGLT